MSFSPDSRHLATGSGDKTARITDIQSNKTIRTITHNDWVTAVAFSPDEYYLLTGSGDGTARVTEI